jgi:hypothetical protein
VGHRSRNDYLSLGLAQCTFQRNDGRKQTLGCCAVPARMLEDTDRLAEWAAKAMEAVR